MHHQTTNVTSSDSYTEKFQLFCKQFETAAPFMMSSLRQRQAEFGEPWVQELGRLIDSFVGKTQENLDKAIHGYIEFALDGMRLQKKFEKTRQYEPKSYDEAKAQVYDDEQYMFDKYLPGILLSHYLWPHHYKQLQFFDRVIAPKLTAMDVLNFCDVGPGTGFYTRQVLERCSNATGNVFDISLHSLEFSRRQVTAFGVSDRFTLQQRDIIANPPQEKFDFLMSVEVLEHLEDPIAFLKALKSMMKPNAYGFITAAVTAANDDHIYLYNTGDEVADQLEEVGFEVIDRQYDKAYEPKKDEPVPINAAFFVKNN